MSKGSLFWANASGKLGETVLYRSGGEQRTRTYVAKIKNPKTLAQMKNRLSMRNFASIYRALQPILSLSFPNRPTKESGFNAFVRANKSVSSAVVSKVGSQSGLSVPYDMLLSQGYLTQFGVFELHSDRSGQTASFNLAAHPNIAAIKALMPSTDSLDGFPTSTTEFQSLWDALQIPQSGKITIVAATYEDEGYSLSYRTLTYESQFDEINTDPWKLRLVPSTTSTSTAEPLLGFELSSSETMLCVIISWKDANGKLQVTTSRMVPVDGSTEFPAQFVEGGDVYAQVLEQYGYNVESAI